MATKKMPVWFEESYPDWKKNLIGALRTLTDGFLATVAIHLLTATGENIVTLDFWLDGVLIGGLAGALVMLGKWLRDKFYESSVAQKMPI